jgi:predicted RNA-binding protein with RPS1 domain
VRTEEEVEKYLDVPNKISLSSLKEGQEVTGEVVKLCSYGAFVDVGANRLGLLHIQKVADLYNKYIAKEEGLIKAGLEVGAGVRLTIKSNHKKRLELDFTQDVKSESEDEQRHQKQKLVEIQISPVTSNEIMEEDELAEWASFASQSNTVIQSVEEVVEDEEIEEVEEEDLVDEDDYDDYDEEKDIEDALGLGFY